MVFGPDRLPHAGRLAIGRHAAAVARFLATALFLVAAGCGGGDDDGLSHDEREVRNAGITWWLQVDAALIANTTALDFGAGGLPRETIGLSVAPPTTMELSGSPLPIRGSLQPTHEYGLNCPDVALTSLDPLRLFIVYGDSGCVSELTGQAHRGNVQLDVDPETRTGLLTARNWTTGAYRVNGAIGASYEDTSVTIDSRELMVSSPDGSVRITSCIGIRWSKGGTRLLISDDSWQILGVADVKTLSLESGAIYRLEVDDTAPIRANSQCEWPTSGRLSIERQEPPLTAMLDFGNGACDSKARLTVSGRTITIDLMNSAD